MIEKYLNLNNDFENQKKKIVYENNNFKNTDKKIKKNQKK